MAIRIGPSEAAAAADLEVGGKLGVDGQDEELGDALAQLLKPLLQRKAGGLDLLLARHEDQDVALWVPCAAKCELLC